MFFTSKPKQAKTPLLPRTSPRAGDRIATKVRRIVENSEKIVKNSGILFAIMV